MKRYLVFSVIVLGILGLFTSVAHAKRSAPEKVKPIIYDGTEYRAPHSHMGCVEAWDVKGKKMLWRKQIYRIEYDPKIETDVQDVFIKNMTLAGHSLIVINEDGHKYKLDLKSLKVYARSLLSYVPVSEEVDNSDEAVVAGNSEFAFDLYAKLKDDPKIKEEGGNLFFSPYSISTALAMTWGGARGETEKQMAKTLHFTLGQERLHPAFGTLEKQLNAGGKEGGYQLSVANALWGQKGKPFHKEFLYLTRKNYGAGLKEVDFAKNTEKARRTINAWVEKKTNDKIKELIGKHVLGRETVLVLTNAIYFKGDWGSKFKEADTKSASFNVTKEKREKVAMMYQKEDFRYAVTDKLQILEMPYKGEHLNMIVLLPKKVDGLAALEDELTLEKLNSWISKLRKQKLMVYLPKFKMTSEFSLADYLGAMGMPDAFSENADFSGMNGKRDLFISAVLHKAFVEVNEEGTEAAAATAVVIGRTSVPPPPPVFRADHPFVFMIKDNRSGSILFMGRVVNPATQDTKDE